MRVVKGSMNDILNSIVAEVLADVVSEQSLGKEITERVNKEVNFNQALGNLAIEHDFTTVDVINNVCGTIFANHCEKVQDRENFDTEKEVHLFHQAGKALLTCMDRELQGQKYTEKLLTLLNAVRVLNTEEKQKQADIDAKAKKEEELKKAKAPTKRECECPGCKAVAELEKALRATAEPLVSNASPDKKEEISDLLEKLFKLVS